MSHALASLERLYDSISELQDRQTPDGNFYQWYLAVSEALEKGFGACSQEDARAHLFEMIFILRRNIDPPSIESY